MNKIGGTFTQWRKVKFSISRRNVNRQLSKMAEDLLPLVGHDMDGDDNDSSDSGG